MLRRRRRGQRGGSALEMAMLLPWYMFLYVGAFDWGFYSHSLISTESAARVAALATSASSSTAADQTLACRLALEELRIAINLASVTTCGASPVVVTAAAAGPGQAIASADNQAATQVSVQYTTQNMIPIPGLLASQATFYRVVQLRLKS